MNKSHHGLGIIRCWDSNPHSCIRFNISPVPRCAPGAFKFSLLVIVDANRSSQVRSCASGGRDLGQLCRFRQVKVMHVLWGQVLFVVES